MGDQFAVTKRVTGLRTGERNVSPFGTDYINDTLFHDASEDGTGFALALDIYSNRGQAQVILYEVEVNVKVLTN